MFLQLLLRVVLGLRFLRMLPLHLLRALMRLLILLVLR